MRPLFAILGALVTPLAFADRNILHDFDGLQSGTYGVSPKQNYHSSNITSPLFNYNSWREELLAGDESSHILLTLNYGDAGPYIFRDDDLSLVYADPSFADVTNARVQEVKGSKYLSFWHGVRLSGSGAGFCVFYDKQYQLKYNVTAIIPATGLADMHECQVTFDGAVLLTVYQEKPYNLSSLGYLGNDTLADSCFQEVDMETNALLFSWCASDHFSIDMTFQDYEQSAAGNNSGRLSPTGGVDVYHINSVQKTREGNYLVSLRSLKQITYVNGTNGQPIWNLNGKLNDFTDITPPSVLAANPNSESALNFGWQHMARFQDEALSEITLFDNHNLTTSVGCTGNSCSRGRLLKIDTSDPRNLTVQLVRDFWSPHGLSSMVMGSMQVLTGSENILVGWGGVAEFSEYTYDGDIVRDIQYSPLDPRTSFGAFGSQVSYRVYKNSWHGYPPWPPSIAINGTGRLWVSWNGATEVRKWALYGNNNQTALGEIDGVGYDSSRSDNIFVNQHPLEILTRAGFETEFLVENWPHDFVKVAALDGNDEIIGTTETVSIDSQPLTCHLNCLVLGSILTP